MRGKSVTSLAIIEAAKAILEDIAPASVRAVCYRLFTQKLIPDMSKNSTQRVGNQLLYAREHGMIDWDDIVDETRSTEIVECWKDDDTFFFRLRKKPMARSV